MSRPAGSGWRPRSSGGAPAAAFLLACCLVGTAATASAQGIDETLQRDLSLFLTGAVVSLHHDGELQFMGAFGKSDSATDEALTTSHLFAYPALSEILLSVMVEALDATDVIDGDAPLSTWLPDLDPGIGSVTLTQLVTHTGGLDDAQRVEGETWERTLDRIDDRALVAPPGLFYSRSRHSFPLAGRVITTALGRPFDEIATTLILDPLHMTSTTFDIAKARARGLVTGVRSNDDSSSPTVSVQATDTLAGLPVLFTTATDVVTLLSTWSSGGLAGRRPHELASAQDPSVDGERAFGGGLWVDEYRGLTRASRRAGDLGISTGFYLVPETGSTVFIWTRGRWSGRTASFVLDAVADAAGAPPRASGSRANSALAAERQPPSPDRWAGTYRNGDLIFVLRDSGGRLVFFDGSRELEVEAGAGTRIVAKLPDGRIAVRLDVMEDPTGRRFLHYRGLAYRHEADELDG